MSTPSGTYRRIPMMDYGDARAEATMILRERLPQLGELAASATIQNSGPSRVPGEVPTPCIVVADDGVVDDAHPFYQMHSIRVVVWHTEDEAASDLIQLCLAVLLNSWRGQLEQCTRDTGPTPAVDPVTELFTQTVDVRARMAGKRS